MSQAGSDNFCYRHPDRQSFVLCQRCGRTVCAQCQTQAAVGVHCPECVREARESAPRTRPAAVTRLRSMSRIDSGVPVVTYGIIALCVLVFLVQLVTGTFGPVFQALAFQRSLAGVEPWRMVTTIFVHLSILHILFNMYSLYVIGPQLEQMLGRIRFAILFLLAGFGGSVAVLFLTDSAVAGASGAIFGMFGAYFVIARHLGANSTQLLVIIGINLVIGFIPSLGFAWQAHVGGLVVGALVGFIFTRTRSRTLRNVQWLALGGTAVGLVALTAAGISILS